VSQKQLSKIWTSIGVVLFYLSFNAWSRTQQWNISLPGIEFKTIGTYGAAIYGMLLCGVILWIELAVANLHAVRSGSQNWAARIPSVFDPQPDFAKIDSKIFQSLTSIGFLLFPIIAQIHFLDIVFLGTVTLKGVPFTTGRRHPLVYVPLGQAFTDKFRYDTALSYLPFWEAWFFVLFEILLVLYLIYVGQSIFFWSDTRRRKGEKEAKIAN